MSFTDKSGGEVQVSIFNKESGLLLTKGSYKYLLHTSKQKLDSQNNVKSSMDFNSKILVTGATGGLGSSVLSILGEKAKGVSLSNSKDFIKLKSYSELSPLYELDNIKSIVHCAGPSPDNVALTSKINLEDDIKQNIANPLRDIISLSKLLIEKGDDQSSLIVIGSSFANVGRHSWAMPMYSLSKSLIPNLTKILALEMSRFNKRIIGVNYEMIDGGMNSHLSIISNQINSDRMLKGSLTTMEDAAKQIEWILNNNEFLISGSLIDCTGGAIP